MRCAAAPWRLAPVVCDPAPPHVQEGAVSSDEDDPIPFNDEFSFEDAGLMSSSAWGFGRSSSMSTNRLLVGWPVWDDPCVM